MKLTTMIRVEKAASFKLLAAGLFVRTSMDGAHSAVVHEGTHSPKSHRRLAACSLKPVAPLLAIRAVLIFGILNFVSSPGFAQFSIGIRTGLSLSNTTVESRFEEASKGGLAIGLTTANTLGKNISLLADIMYVQKGYNHQICNQCYDKFTATFVEIPIAFRYSFYLPKISPKLENLKAHASGGLYLAQWLNAEYETKIFDNRTQEEFVFTGEKRMDFGPNFGAGLEYMLFSGSLVLDARYSMGTVDMSKPGSTTASKNKSWILSLSWLKSF